LTLGDRIARPATIHLAYKCIAIKRQLSLWGCMDWRLMNLTDKYYC